MSTIIQTNQRPIRVSHWFPPFTKLNVNNNDHHMYVCRLFLSSMRCSSMYQMPRQLPFIERLRALPPEQCISRTPNSWIRPSTIPYTSSSSSEFHGIPSPAPSKSNYPVLLPPTWATHFPYPASAFQVCIVSSSFIQTTRTCPYVVPCVIRLLVRYQSINRPWHACTTHSPDDQLLSKTKAINEKPYSQPDMPYVKW